MAADGLQAGVSRWQGTARTMANVQVCRNGFGGRQAVRRATC